MICAHCGMKIDDSINDFCVFKNKGQIKLGDFVQVIDKKNNKVIIQGVIQYEKVNCFNPSPTKFNDLVGNQKLYSVDNRYFFKLDDRDYIVKKLDPLFVNEDFIEDNYATTGWSEYSKTDRKDFKMYKENTVLELDAEVKNVVNTLNRFSPRLSTSGSCSGHDKSPAWISFNIDDARTFQDFVNIFEPFKYEIDLTTSVTLHQQREHFCGKPYFPRDIMLMIKTKKVGKEAYEALNEFDKYLNRVVSLRNKADAWFDDLIAEETMCQRQKQRN